MKVKQKIFGSRGRTELVRHFLPALLAIACTGAAYAQNDKHMLLLKNIDTAHVSAADEPEIDRERDLPEVVSGWFHKKAPAVKNNAITSKPSFTIVPAVGYTLVTRLAGVLSGNALFRIDSSANISTVTANATYTQNSQFYSPVKANIYTHNNSFNLVGDVQFYKYPQVSYGLGSSSPVSNADPMDYHYFRFNAIALKKLSGRLYAGLGYTLDYRWGISEAGIKSGAKSDYSKYGAATHTSSSGLSLNAVFNTRDNPVNAFTGTYGLLQLRNNATFLGSDNNWQSLIIDVRKYLRLSQGGNSVLALWSYNWLVLHGKPPYLDLPSIGWDVNSATGRGYIQSRFRGGQMVYGEAEYRFQLVPGGLLGGVLFANASTFSGAPGSGLQRVQPGFGPGIRIKLNKKTRTNIAIDYGFGSQGSKGLFVNVGEVF